MKLSVKSDYAARAVLGLALQHPAGKPVRIESLAKAQAVPANYLVQILIELKGQGIVKSVRGKEGGYRLARQPADITLADVLEAVHGQVFEFPALGDSDCPPELRRAWGQLKMATEAAASGVNFQQLVDESGDREKMYYI